MSELHIKFGQWLHDSLLDTPALHPPHGPIFSYWLPDGERDAIQLKSDDPDATVTVWFERYGHKPDGQMVVFSKDKREVDDEAVANQAVLDAGPLHGRIRLQNVPEQTLDVLRSGNMADERYPKLGKRIAKLLFGTVGQFVSLLRVFYGQYWLRELSPWDSRDISIGMYCRRWGVKWSEDGVDWKEFKPDEEITARRPGIFRAQFRFEEFLSKDDWEALKTTALQDHKPSIATYLLNRCHRLIIKGEMRYALIEGMSALEIALDEHVARKCNGPLKNEVFNDKFVNMHAVGKMALVSYMVPGIDPKDIEGAAKAIECRNEMIHEGTEPPKECIDWLNAVMRILACLLDGPTFKFPVYDGSNSFGPPYRK